MKEGSVQDFRNLKVWDKAHALTLDVYKASNAFPREEMYGLTSQMRRASVSIGANIAEGACRKGDVDFARFLQIAVGSASELEYHLLLARDLQLLGSSDYRRLSDEAVEVKRMLASLMQKLRADS
ncbi:MAG TPA: four helix bundle protein [Candidatus Sulfotelmatobacter sp.]|nr:four helix bundle protein [Candidatus Sulfotelmatobacter sp.]